MSPGRTYAEACGIARGLDAVGDRWALLVVRELLLGPKRFTDLQADLPGPSPNVLSQRLRDLEEAGVVRRVELRRPASGRAYALTEWGAGLAPVLAELGQWGARSPAPIAPAMSRDSLVFAMSTVFEPTRVGDLDGAFELELESEAYSVRLAAGQLDVRRGAPDAPVARIATDRATLVGLLWEGLELRTAVREGRVEIEGEAGDVEALLRCFDVSR